MVDKTNESPPADPESADRPKKSVVPISPKKNINSEDDRRRYKPSRASIRGH